MRSRLAVWLMLSLLATSAYSAVRRRRPPAHSVSTSTSLRKRLHVNNLITESGTAELETGGNVSVIGDLTGGFTLPTVLKFTPTRTNTEFSVGFDGLASDVSSQNHRVTQFSDRVTLAAIHEFPAWHGLSLAGGPQASFFTHNGNGARLGGVALARGNYRGFDGGVSALWTQATHATPANPTRLLDLGAGLGHRLSPRLTAHVNYLYEKATTYSPQHSLYEGVEFQLTPKFALDVTVQQIGLGGTVDYEAVIGLTANLGRPGSWLVRRH